MLHHTNKSRNSIYYMASKSSSLEKRKKEKIREVKKLLTQIMKEIKEKADKIDKVRIRKRVSKIRGRYRATKMIIRYLDKKIDIDLRGIDDKLEIIRKTFKFEDFVYDLAYKMSVKNLKKYFARRGERVLHCWVPEDLYIELYVETDKGLYTYRFVDYVNYYDTYYFKVKKRKLHKSL